MKGSIRQRGDTFTAYWFTTDPATGARRQHSKGGFVRENPARPPRGDSAREHLNSVLGKVQDDTWRPEKPLTVKDLLELHWLPAMTSRGLRPATLSQYRMVVKSWLVPQLGAFKVKSLTPGPMGTAVEALRSTKTAQGRKGLSDRSVQLAVGTLKAATTWAVKNGLLARDPLIGYDRPKATSKEMTAWTTDEARAFLASTSGDRLAVVWALALTRGLRRGELAGLRWDAIDLEGGTLQVRHTRVVVDGKVIDSVPKTSAGRRSVPLDSSLVALLKSHKAHQAAEKLANRPAYQDGGYVAADELGRPYYPDSLSTWFEDHTEAAKLRKVRFHDLRHTAASLMLGAGVPVKVVSEMLGHSSPIITLSIYQHTLPSMAKEAAEALSASLLG